MRTFDSDPRNTTDILVFRYGSDPFGSWNQTTPGPLAVLVNAMLGNESWFYQVRNATNAQEERDALIAACIRGLPFATYTGYIRNGFSASNGQCSFLNFPGKVPEPETDLTTSANSTADAEIVRDLSRIVAEWFSGFGYDNSTEDALEAGMYLANEALLTLTADASRMDSARPIYFSNGTSVMKPSMRYPAKATVSFLILLETTGLIGLAVFIYRMPTFASRLDSVHVATIGSQLARQMGADLPPLSLRPRGLARQKYLKELEDVDGLIGVQEDIELAPLRSSAITPRTSVTLTPAASLHYPSSATSSLPHSSQPQGPTSPSASTPNSSTIPPPPPPPPPSTPAAAHRPISGSYISPPFNPRPLPRPISFASVTSHHTDDDIISVSALDAVSEVRTADDPDAPPKYGDVIQADDARHFGAPQRKKLVVGGSGRITREMATQPKRGRQVGTAAAVAATGRGGRWGRAGGRGRGGGNGSNNATRPGASGMMGTGTTPRAGVASPAVVNNHTLRNRSHRNSLVGPAAVVGVGHVQGETQASGLRSSRTVGTG